MTAPSAPPGTDRPPTPSNPSPSRARRVDWFGACCLAATLASVAVLALVLIAVFWQGAGSLSWRFLKGMSSSRAANAGILPALAGSLWLMGLTILFSLPIGVATAVYLEEYALDHAYGIGPLKLRWKRLVQLNISNLAAVPSIVYGILGLGLFVRTLAMGRSLLAGALTLSLVVLPVVILSTQEALRAVPGTIRLAAYALGATRWQTIWHQVLPAAIPGIMTGVILAISRALGEAAPLLTVGAVAFVSFVPSSLGDEFTALPIQIYNWTARPQAEFHQLAAAGIIVLLVVLIALNTIAVRLRTHYSRKLRW